MKYVVCYSGGHQSALVAIEAVRKHGKDNVILLNHDISPNVEHEDIKRFKGEVAEELKLKITYANMDGWETMDQFDVCVKAQAFHSGDNQILCTNRLKTAPFEKWLKENIPTQCGSAVILYGFDANEPNRIIRRSQIMGVKGYQTEFPLAFWERTIQFTEEIGIKRPVTYKLFNHANCQACLKSGKQHWYIVYCTRPDLWEKAKWAESKIGHSIIKNVYIHELESEFEEMKVSGIVPTEKKKQQQFWKEVRQRNQLSWFDDLPCNCSD